MLKKYNLAKKIFIILLAFLIINGQVVAFARAGGGGGGGSSGGGGGGSSSGGGTSSSRSSGRNSGVSFNPVGLLIFIVSVSAGTVTYRIRLAKKKSQSVSIIRKLSKEDKNWNYKNIKKDIKEAFYEIQNAWMERDQDLAKDYMSENLYDRHKSQTEWMKIRKEKNILENITLLGAKPVGVEDYDGTSKDSLWVHIKGKSVDYTINEETSKVIKGKKYIPTYYEEYWRFIKKEDRWVLDEIRQISDIDDLDFFKIDV